TRRRRLLGPRDYGRVMTLEEFEACGERPGYVAELIDGVVHVSPSGKPYHHNWQSAIGFALTEFSRGHPSVFNHVTFDNDVVIPGRPAASRPRPDIAAYRDFRLKESFRRGADWAEFCPVLVVEIISRRRARKDTTRNRQLYWFAGGIAEYWIIDTRPDPAKPALIALARTAGRPEWEERRIGFGEAYRAPSFEGLSINLKDLARGN
ncbi:MAG: Uma2 family endonuclease, partial [Phycisphaerae bacterium]|nr:Uma2 family endonuclease [Phycisphaerae bacterium]